MRRFVSTITLTLLCCSPVAAERSSAKATAVPIIYTTDLYHPHDDPDDHFDLVTLFSIAEFDVRAVVFDLGKRGANRPGIVALRQIMHISGRTVPYATGLTANLRSRDDGAEQQPDAAQAGVRLILKALRESRERVAVFCTGSLRDVAAAYNRSPDLFEAKVGRLYINAGHSGSGREWNVGLDPHAYVRMLRSRLPTYWVPCFGIDGYESLWEFRQGDVLDAAPQALQNFFIYALTKTSPESRDPLAALKEAPLENIKQKIWKQQRKMWCTAAFLHAAARTNPTFSFKDTHVQLDDAGVTQIVSSDKGIEILTFHQDDPAAYAPTMRETLRDLFGQWNGIP